MCSVGGHEHGWETLCQGSRRGARTQMQSMHRTQYGLLFNLTPTPSTSAAMLAALIRLFPKHNLCI